MTETHITVVTVSYKSAELTKNSLSSVFEQKTADAALNIKAIVVDNASGDAEVIQAFVNAQGWTDWVTVITAPKNGGFGYGNNLAFRYALANWEVDFFHLLNPDAVARNNAFKPLVAFMKANAKVGVVGSQLENIEGVVESSAHRFHSPINELIESARLGIISKLLHHHDLTPPIQDVPFECDWVSGASMMIRKEVLDQIGFFDENYFLYFEEVDLFYRLQKMGWQTWYVPDSRVMHIEGASTGIKLVRRRPQYWYESRRRLFVKLYGVLGLMAADVLWLIGRVSYLTRRYFKLGAQKPNNDPKWFMFDLLYGDIKSIATFKVWQLKSEKVD
jgi:GT2 family glycosyltransferase